MGWKPTAAPSVLTTKGDVHTYDTDDARLGVGADTHVLTADSAQALGIKWAAAGGGGGGALSLLTENVLGADAASMSSAALSGSHKDMLVVAEFRTARATVKSDIIHMQLGNAGIDTGSNYNYFRTFEGSANNTATAFAATFIDCGITLCPTTVADAYSAMIIWLPGFADTDHHKGMSIIHTAIEDSEYWWTKVSGRWESTSAITDIKFFSANAANLVAGSRYAVYGLN